MATRAYMDMDINDRCGFHVLAVDYRGYGESSGVYPLSETTLVSDTQVDNLTLYLKCT